MFFRLILCLLLLVTAVSAQRRFVPDSAKPPSATIAVSPDGLTVAVARSNGGAVKSFGRVELWNMRTGELQRTITGFDGPIWSMTFSRDGRSVITASTEFRESKIQTSVKDRQEKVVAELKWWDTQSGEFIKKLSLATEGVTSVEAAWSTAGDMLAVIERHSAHRLTQITEPGAFSQQIIRPGFVYVEEVDLKLLDAQTGQKKVKVEDAAQIYHDYRALIFARLEHPLFSPDGKVLAALVAEEVILWSVDTGKKLWTLKKLGGAPSAIAFSPDGRLFAVAAIKGTMPGGESEITVWDLATRKAVNGLKGKNDSIACLQFAAQGRALLIGSLQYEPEAAMGTVKMWDLRDNRLARFNVREGKAVSSLALIPVQSAVVLQSESNVELRDTKTWEVKHSFESTEDSETESNRRSRFLLTANRAVAVAFSRDGTTVSAEIPGEGVRRWDSRTGGVKNRVPLEKDLEATAVAISSNGDLLVEASAQEVRLTDPVAGTSKVVGARVNGPISAVALSRDGQLLAIGSGEKITIRKVAQEAPSITLDGGVDFLSFSDDGRSLVSADETGQIEVWDVSTGSLRRTIDAGQKVTAIAIDPSGQLLASARADHSISVWNVQTGVLQGELKKHDNVVNALAFSADGKTLASGGDDRTAILWDIPSGKSKRTLKGHDLTVTSLAFSTDGLTLASGSGNASVVLWNVTSGKLDRILR